MILEGSLLEDPTLAQLSRFSFIGFFFLGDTLKARFAWKKGLGMVHHVMLLKNVAKERKQCFLQVFLFFFTNR